MTIETKFEEIKTIRVFIKNTFKLLTEKHVEIKSQYKTYIDANRKCEYLDAFYFQIKLLDYDYDTTNKLYNYIDNRIYCDYYKLFIIIYSFFKLNFKNEKSEMILKNTKYPIYKDLEPYKIYDFDMINDIHQDIIRLIEYINKIIQQNEDEIKAHQTKLTSGINIDNYIHNLEYHNNIIVNNVNLYKKYLSAYHTYHISFLSNLNSKLNCIHEQLDNDINFTQPIKEKKSIIMTKICKRCCKKEAVYCETCMNEENEQYMRLSDLRNNISHNIDESIDESIDKDMPNLTNDIVEPIIENIIVQPFVEPIVENIIVENIIVKPIMVEPFTEIIENIIVEPNVNIITEIIENIITEIVEPNIVENIIIEPLNEITQCMSELINEITEPEGEPPEIKTHVRPTQLFTIYESNLNDNSLYINTDLVNAIISNPINDSILSDSINESMPISEPMSEPMPISEPISEPNIDITIDNKTNTDDIERKINNNPPFFLDINIPMNELNHPKKKKKHKK